MSRIFHPLGMVDTTLYPTDEQKKRLAMLYKPSQDKKSIEPATAAPSAPEAGSPPGAR